LIYRANGWRLQSCACRGDGTAYFSFLGERKVPKESPLKESTQVLSLRILSPVRRCPFCPSAKRPNALVLHGSPAVRNLGGAPSSRVLPVRGDNSRDFLFLLRVLGICRADGAPPFVRAIGCPRPSAQSDSFATPMAKESRGDGGLRKGGPSLTWRSFGTFLSTGREKYTDHSPDNPPIYLTAKCKSIRRCPR